MLYSYFRLNKKSKQLIDLFEWEFQLEDSKRLDKKISKLNEFQFFQLCMNAFYNFPVDSWELERLELLFKKSSYTKNSNLNYLPFIDDSEQEPNKIIIEEYVSFNYSKELDAFVDYVINSNEYTTASHRQKLLALSDIIISELIQIVHVIDNHFECFLDYVEHNINSCGNKIYYSLLIRAALKDFEDSLYLTLENIDIKIKSIQNGESFSIDSYNLQINDTIINKLYIELERNQFIDIDKTSKEDFLKVLTYNWKEHKSIIHFEMNNIQFKHFIDVFSKTFEVKIPLTKIQFAKNIKNKNGYIKSAAVYASKSKSKVLPKDADLIENIIISVKKG